MNDRERRLYEKFLRQRDAAVARSADFAPNTLGAQTLAVLTGVINEIESLSASEASSRGSARQGTERRAQARAALREDLEAIARTARVMTAEMPGLEDKFRAPRNNNDNDMLIAARAFHADATPLKAQFIAHELPADFLEDLQDDINAMQEAISDQSSGVGNHVASSAALDDAFSRGVDASRKLDVIMRNKYANNPAVMAEWIRASHTERAPRRATAGGQPTTPPTPTP